MSSTAEDNDRDVFQGLSPEEQLSVLYTSPLSIFTLVISAVHAGSFGVLLVATPLYGLAAIGLFDDQFFPDPIQQATAVSGVPVLTRLIYLLGPLIGIVSIAVYRFVRALEKTIRLRAVAARIENEAQASLLAETIGLVNERSRLGDQVVTWEPGDASYDAYAEVAQAVERKKMELLGPLNVTRLLLWGAILLNGYAIGLQFYYGIQWGLASYWLAIPVLATWILSWLLVALLACNKRPS